jgi:hypothetical protein
MFLLAKFQVEQAPRPQQVHIPLNWVISGGDVRKGEALIIAVAAQQIIRETSYLTGICARAYFSLVSLACHT